MSHRHHVTQHLLTCTLALVACAGPRQALLAASAPTYHGRCRVHLRQGQGTPATYPVTPLQAHDIAKRLLEQQHGLALEDTPTDGFLVVTIEDPHPLFSPEPATTTVCLQITPVDSTHTTVTVLTEARHLLALGRKALSEGEFHREFAAALSQQGTTTPSVPR